MTKGKLRIRSLADIKEQFYLGVIRERYKGRTGKVLGRRGKRNLSLSTEKSSLDHYSRF